MRMNSIHKLDKGLDTVGVAGSTPVEPTIFLQAKPALIREIKRHFQVVPAVDWTSGVPSFSLCLVQKSISGSEKAVKRPRGRPRKSA